VAESILAPIAALSLPDQAKITNSAQQALSFIDSFAIFDVETYGLAADELRAIKVKANRLEEQRTAITGPINSALRAINDLFRAPAELLSRAESTLKGKMLSWDSEQERIAAEARRKAEEAAAVERRRLEEEAVARQREAYAQTAAAAAAQAAGDAQAAAIAQANAARAQAEAAAAATTAQVVVAAPVQMPLKVDGISTSTRIDFELTDLHALIKHVAEHPELLSLVGANDTRLRAYVKGLGLACKLPGVRVFEDKVMSARTK
jgi:chemotaxis protein histidine kinase CheA